MSVRVEPDAGAGRAVIRVTGAAGTANTPGFRIQREDYDDNTLGPSGWQSSDAVLAPDRAEANGPDLVLHVGWPVCQHLEAGVYLFALPAAGLEPEPVFWPDIAPLHAGATDVLSPTAATAAPAPEPPVVAKPRPVAPALPPAPPPVPDPPLPPPPLPVASSPTRSRAPLYGLLVLLLLLAAGGAAWWKYRQAPPVTEAQVQPPVVTPTPPTPPATTPPATTPPAPPPPPPSLQLGGLPVPDVIARAPNPAAIAAEGARRLQGDRHDDGLLLLEAAADHGDGGASAALGKLYDPVLFQPGGPIPRPDPRQAARYYRDAARAGADVAAAREALKHSLEAKAQSGDLSANLTLKDFWP